MQVSLLHQVLSLIGAALVLVGYVGHQAKWLDARGAAYNLVNAVGAALLVYAALQPFQAGFVVLESVWTIASLVALVNVLRPRAAQRDGAD